MITSKTIALIKKHEAAKGANLKPYRCTAGKLTIGFGRNLDDRGITEVEAEYLLANDLAQGDRDARSLFSTFDSMSDARQGVLTDMAINLGRSRLAGFKKFIAATTKGDWQEASKEMLDSDAARELPNRYNELANIFQRGEW